MALKLVACLKAAVSNFAAKGELLELAIHPDDTILDAILDFALFSNWQWTTTVPTTMITTAFKKNQ